MTTINLAIGPLVSLIAGILILIIPRLLNYIVAIYLIVIGLIGIFGWGGTHVSSAMGNGDAAQAVAEHQVLAQCAGMQSLSSLPAGGFARGANACRSRRMIMKSAGMPM